ncbi:MAG: Rieske 2Fe-2S domain-containing protein, partial [Actinomycetota bacterium]
MTDITHRSTSAVVGTVDDLAEGQMKMAKVGEHRVVVVRTASGIHALDNACPHQGYGLATGALDGELVTCQWHNWKFRVDTGEAVMGEENVACHHVCVSGDEITVTVTE